MIRLPVADGPELRAQARVLAGRHRKAVLGTVALHATAAAAGLAGPRLLGGLVESVRNGTTRAHVDRVAVVLAAFLVVQTGAPAPVISSRARRPTSTRSREPFA